MLSFADVSLAQLTPRLRTICNRWWAEHAPDLWQFSGYQIATSGHLPFPSQPNPEQARLNVLVWPTGASRWGQLHAICGDVALTAIRAVTTTTAPTPQTLLVRDDTNGTQVAPSMFLIAARPIFVQGVTNQKLYWLTFVDARYFWWQQQATFTFTAGDNWATLLTNLVDAASTLTPDLPTIDAAYGTPNPLRWSTEGTPLPLLIDAAAASIGGRFLYYIDGTCEVQSADDAATADDARWTANSASVVLGGRNTVAELAGNIPSSVAVGFWGDTQEITTKTLTGLALSAWYGITGVSNTYAWIMGDRYAGKTSPTASDYAVQAATDYYGWALSRTDATFRSIRGDAETMLPNGLDDRIEWEYCPAIAPETDESGDVLNQRLPEVRLLTRVVRSNLADRNVYGGRAPAGYTYTTRLTAGPSGGKYKGVIRIVALGGSASDGPQVGFSGDTYNIYPATGTTPAVGDYGTVTPDPFIPGVWLFVPSSNPTDTSSACASAITWATTECLLATFVSASGECEDIDTSQQISMAWVGGDSKWEGSDFAFDGGTGLIKFWFNNGLPTATIDGHYGMYLGCCGTGLSFAFGGTGLCAGDYISCGDNGFIACISCYCCPDPDWTGPGWYCLGDTNCVYIPLPPPCDGDYDIVSGPHADEATCIVACGGTGSVAVPCCPSDELLPTTLTLTVTGDDTGTATLTWDGTKWGGSFTSGNGYGVVFALECVPSYFWQVTWVVTAPGGGASSSPIGTTGDCTPFLLEGGPFTNWNSDPVDELVYFTITV